MNKPTDIIENALENIGFETLNDLQKETIVKAKNASNLLILSQTGSGKTVAFLLPLLLQLKEKSTHIQAIILAPSRELAIQIEAVFKSFKTQHKVTTCYGGHSMRVEQNSLSEAPALLIGTPGRICDHITRNTIDLSEVKQLVIDEYDKCLEFGFEDQMKFIHQELEQLKRISLVSATALKEFPEFLNFSEPSVINYLDKSSEPAITFWKFPIQKATKFEQLYDLLCSFNGEPTIVFCNFREATQSIHEFLEEGNFESIIYHGGMEQEERERALIKFRNGSSHTLICTDLGSRGLDIPEIQHVVHFQYPNSEEAFIHRNGRTARMKANGASYLLMDKAETLPPYLSAKFQEYKLPDQIPYPTESEWATLYFSGGKKDKINKIDFVGFLGQKGQLAKEEIGIITVLDFSSYVAVKRTKVKTLLRSIQQEKIKGKKLKIALSK